MNNNNKTHFTFIDLFAGIGGFHMAMHNIGGECVFASELDTHARQTYQHNFQSLSPSLFKNNLFNADIRKIDPREIPDFDVLCAGFPCQPFSQAGYKRGFEDNHNSERGNLFFNIAEILEVKRPKAFFLENVRGLLNHDGGNTFKVIRNILESELGYSFYYKIIKATDYGLPQLRPRLFMIGFRDEGFMKGFNFPNSLPLKFNMSDVWQGECSREIGFTIRVGGRGSTINDRRNWDAYMVDGKVKQLGIEQAKKMQGFPHNFEFPVSNTQAMKQLGNSVAIDAIQAVGEQMINYLNKLNPKDIDIMKQTMNKGEWSELFVFIKMLVEQKLFLSDKDLNKKDIFFDVSKVTTRNLDSDFYIIDSTTIKKKDRNTGLEENIDIKDILSDNQISTILEEIVNGKATFTIPEFDIIRSTLGFEVIKGGTSNQKSDIVLDINIPDKSVDKKDEGFGIKSFLGSTPTLLNASGNTNFIFELENIKATDIDAINDIDTRTKLVDRIKMIEELGGNLNYIGAEREIMDYNLKMTDSLMPKVIGYILIAFFKNRINRISDIVNYIHKEGKLQKEIQYNDIDMLTNKVSNLLVNILLGMFAEDKWDGNFLSNGTIVLKKDGNCVGFHVIDLASLKEYLFHTIKLDTPSTSRHRFGSAYIEDGKVYFKLNMQLRF